MLELDLAAALSYVQAFLKVATDSAFPGQGLPVPWKRM